MYGDGAAILFESDAGSIVDIGTNPIAQVSSIAVLEIPDVTIPIITHAFVNYTDGTMHLTFSEIIDQTPDTDVDLSKFVIRNISNEGTGIALTGASVTSVDGTTLNITMTEVQRTLAIAISGPPGGDNHPVVLDISAGGIRDISQNDIATTLDFPVSEFLDMLPPRLISVQVDYGYGYILQADEFVDLTSITLVNQSSLRFQQFWRLCFVNIVQISICISW